MVLPTLSPNKFCELSPQIIIVAGAAAWPVKDFIDYCTQNRLDVPAVRKRQVYHLHPYRAATNPDWVLGLMRLATLIHPDVFQLNLAREANDFYKEFFKIPFGDGHSRAFPHLRRQHMSIAKEPIHVA